MALHLLTCCNNSEVGGKVLSRVAMAHPDKLGVISLIGIQLAGLCCPDTHLAILATQARSLHLAPKSVDHELHPCIETDTAQAKADTDIWHNR